MKKKLALVLAAAMVMGTVLTGCSSGGGSTQAAAPEATEAPKEAETEGGAAESEAAGTVKVLCRVQKVWDYRPTL